MVVARLVRCPLVTYQRGDETARAEAALSELFLFGGACESVAEEKHDIQIVIHLLRHGTGHANALVACPITGSASVNQ